MDIVRVIDSNRETIMVFSFVRSVNGAQTRLFNYVMNFPGLFDENGFKIVFIPRYTSKDETVYAIVLQWPSDNTLELMAPNADPAKTKVAMLGLSVDIHWKQGAGEKGMVIEMPRVPLTQLPSDWAWILKLTNVK